MMALVQPLARALCKDEHSGWEYDDEEEHEEHLGHAEVLLSKMAHDKQLQSDIFFLFPEGASYSVLDILRMLFGVVREI